MSVTGAIEFDEATHTYRVDGEVWPGVTTILEPIQQFDGVPLRLLQAAAAFGQNVHAAVHLLNQGRLDRASLDPLLAPYVAAWEQLLRDTGAVVVESERRVSNAKHRYCGTIDSVVRWRGRRVLLDVKSSAVPPKSARPQTAAYAAAMGEPRIPRYVAHLRGNGTYQLIPHTSSIDWSVFISCLTIWRFRNGR